MALEQKTPSLCLKDIGTQLKKKDWAYSNDIPS
jgi:hypothetical protein